MYMLVDGALLQNSLETESKTLLNKTDQLSALYTELAFMYIMQQTDAEKIGLEYIAGVVVLTITQIPGNFKLLYNIAF